MFNSHFVQINYYAHSATKLEHKDPVYDINVSLSR